MRKRHPENTNIKLHYSPIWEGLSVLARPDQPLSQSYLSALRSTLNQALQEHPRTCVMHFIARLPCGWQGPFGGLADRFIQSLRAQIEADLKRKRRQGKRVHDCHVRMIWCREFGVEGQPHYHIAILVNRDAYSVLGKVGGRHEPDYPWWLEEDEAAVNMAERIQRAWSRGLQISPVLGRPLIHFPDNAVQLVSRNSPSFLDSYRAVFRRLSYLTKVNTKVYEDGYKNFGCSRDRAVSFYREALSHE